jgi:hypothetical protein
MKKTLIALTAATALAAGTVTLPSTANAVPAWFWPTLIIGGVLTTGAVVAASQANAAYYNPYVVEPRGRISVRPAGYCRVETVRTSRGLRRVEVC